MNVSSSTSTTNESASYYSRITGLASGLDTDSIVKAQMQKYQAGIDSAAQQKQKYEWQQEAYREVISDLKDFYSKYTDITNSDTNLVLSANYNTAFFTTSDTTGAVSAQGLAGATVGSYNIKVTSIATKATGIFANLDSLGSSSAFSINGENITVDFSGCATDDEKMAKLNKDLSSAGIDAKMTKSTLSGYVLQTNKTGASQSMEIKVNGTSIFSDCGSDADVTVTDSYGTMLQKNYSTNNIVIDNVQFTVSGVTSGSGVSFTGKTDVSDLKKRIVDFVENYNKLISGINSKLQEKKNSDYPPLTDAQKEEMTDEQIANWEAKSKTGILRNDSYLTSIISQMRKAINTSVGTSALNYSDLGIDFENDYSKTGQLTVDEAKLTEVLQNYPEEVVTLFTSTSTLSDKSAKYNDTGIVQRLKNILNDNINNSSSLLLKKAGYEGSSTYTSNTLQAEIDKQTKLIKSLEENYKARETVLYKKYAELESAMTAYNYQLSALTY